MTTQTTAGPDLELEPTGPGPEVIDRPALKAFQDSTKNETRAYVLFYRWHTDGIRITQEQRNWRGELIDPLELIDLPVSAAVTAYGSDFRSDRTSRHDTVRRWEASNGISSPAYDNEWKTIVRALRIGDRIHLEWLRGNNSEAIETRGCVRDELRLQIIGLGDKPRASFLIDVYVGPDNTARMVRL